MCLMNLIYRALWRPSGTGVHTQWLMGGGVPGGVTRGEGTHLMGVGVCPMHACESNSSIGGLLRR